MEQPGGGRTGSGTVFKSRIDLVPIERGGIVAGPGMLLPPEMQSVLAAAASMYDLVGFNPPWICYLATSDGQAIGTCGFTNSPVEGRVEIAYFTFPDYEGRGIATTMAMGLADLALRSEPGVTVMAQTLADRNASHRVLEKSGFSPVGMLQHPEEGTVMEWMRMPAA
jgi:[ribosomal protein S5]-alanine N-acetyltransferase